MVGRIVGILAKLLFLSLLLFVFSVAASMAVGLTGSAHAAHQVTTAQSPSEEKMPPNPTMTQQEQMRAATGLAMACALQTAVFGFIVLRSRWRGWKLVVTLFLVFYGVTTVMSQMEMLVFLPWSMSSGMLPKLLAAHLLSSGFFSLVTVCVLGRFGSAATTPWAVPPTPEGTLEEVRSNAPRRVGLRFGGATLVYVMLYVTFGYFIIWRNPVGRNFYGGDSAVASTFPVAVWHMIRHEPLMLALQAFRGLLFVALALPVLRMWAGRKWEAGLAVALLFGVVFPAQLLVPNPWMPDALRFLHLLETSTSMFLFGWVVWWLIDPVFRTRRQAG